MNQQLLETARYCDAPVDDRCVCCDRHCTGLEAYCPGCKAPLEVSRTVHSRGLPARFVSILGASGAGKTVYLGVLLDILSKGHLGLRGLVNNPFSVAVQEQTIRALECRQFPEKTPAEADAWKWVYSEVSREKRSRHYLDLITPDFAGEAISLELERQGTYPAIKAMVEKSHACLALFDSLRVRDEAVHEDIFGLKLVSYIHGLRAVHDRRQRGRGIKMPLAIVFTKADGCLEAHADPARFAEHNLPRLVGFCERHFSCVRFFAASVVGSAAMLVDHYARRMQVPFHIEPRGVVEPLVWIMEQ